MDIGGHLREARERRGMTLHEVASSTKLSTTTLRYIERNELARLPGGIFTKGYLRAYAAAVGVNAEEVVNAYLAQCPDAAAPQELPTVRAPAMENPRAGWGLVTVIAAIVLAFLVYGSLEDSDEPPMNASAQQVRPPEPTVALLTESIAAGLLPATELREQGLRLEIQPTGVCWVSVVADGRLVIYRLLQGGEQATAIARQELVLRVGDPEMFEYALNGVPGRRLGEAGRPVTVHITEDNYESFLDGAAPEARRGLAGSLT